MDQNAINISRRKEAKVIIEAQKQTSVPYRVYTDLEIEKFLEEDKIEKETVE